MSEFMRLCLLVCPLIFIAGFVDSVAGGGGIISLPAYLMAGLPAHLAAGTNKVVNGCGTSIATLKYFRSGKVRVRLAAAAAAGAFLGSAIGAQLASLIPELALKVIMLIALPCAALFMVVRKDFGTEQAQREETDGKKAFVISALIGVLIGCYDGLVGPGTGTFMIMAFTAFLSMDLLSCRILITLDLSTPSAIADTAATQKTIARTRARKRFIIMFLL